MGLSIFLGAMAIAAGVFLGLTNMAELLSKAIVDAARIKAGAKDPDADTAAKSANAQPAQRDSSA